MTFSVSGDAKVSGTGNGNPTSIEADQSVERRAFHGLAQAIILVGRKPGSVIVQAVSEDLGSGRSMMISIPA
jgi:beta-galactosidase